MSLPVETKFSTAKALVLGQCKVNYSACLGQTSPTGEGEFPRDFRGMSVKEPRLIGNRLDRVPFPTPGTPPALVSRQSTTDQRNGQVSRPRFIMSWYFYLSHSRFDLGRRLYQNAALRLSEHAHLENKTLFDHKQQATTALPIGGGTEPRGRRERLALWENTFK